MNGRINLDDCLYVISTRGAHIVEDDEHAYVVEFTARRMTDEGEMSEQDEVVVIGLVAEAAGDLIRELVAAMAKYSPNALYDAGVVAAPYEIGRGGGDEA